MFKHREEQTCANISMDTMLSVVFFYSFCLFIYFQVICFNAILGREKYCFFELVLSPAPFNYGEHEAEDPVWLLSELSKDS